MAFDVQLLDVSSQSFRQRVAAEVDDLGARATQMDISCKMWPNEKVAPARGLGDGGKGRRCQVGHDEVGTVVIECWTIVVGIVDRLWRVQHSLDWPAIKMECTHRAMER